MTLPASHLRSLSSRRKPLRRLLPKPKGSTRSSCLIAIRFIGSLVEGGWPEVMRRNHALALRGRDILAQRLGIVPPVPDEMLGSMAALPLPDGNALTAPSLYGDPLQDALLEQYRIEVPIVPWPHPPKRVLRISAQLYNDESEYELLADALGALLASR